MSTASSHAIGPAPLKTALVVDTDPRVEAVLRGALDPHSWSIQYVSDNLAALAVAEASPYDLVLTGEKTSGKEEVELLRKLRRVRPHTQLVILIDEATPADVLASMREHAFRYFSKPLSYESLGYVIQLAAERPYWDDGIEILLSTTALDTCRCTMRFEHCRAVC